MALPRLSAPTQKLLKEATRRIVDVAHPKRILLFGSAARGSMKKDSDFDMLVIMRAPVHRRQMAQKIYRGLRGVGIAVDVVIVTEADLKKYGSRLGTIIRPALQDGQTLYEG